MRPSQNHRFVQSFSPRASLARVLVAVACAGLFTTACGDKSVVNAVVGVLSSISITPNPDTIAANGSQQFSAVGKDFVGASVAMTPVWSIVGGGGTITASGMFTAGATTGTFVTVKATSGSISSMATVVVRAGALASIVVSPNAAAMNVGLTQQFTAVGKDASGNPIAIAPVWSVVAGGGTIGTDGLFTAGAIAGTFANTVTATVGGIAGTATVIVTPVGALATITLTPNPVTMVAGAAQQFTAVGKDAAGNVISIVPTWAVVAGGGTIDTTGRFTAGVVAGTYTNSIRATVGAVTGFATVIVNAAPAGPLATVTVTPNPVNVQTNGLQTFVAVGRDAAGNIVLITPVWSVVNGGGTIDAGTGIFTAGGAAGTFTGTIKATSGAISGVATVTVTTPLPPLATITVTPNPASVIAGAAQPFVAVGRDAAGNVSAITPVWSVVNGGGTIDANTGAFTAGIVAGTYANTIKATSGTISGLATVTVTAVVPAPKLTTITVTPNPVTILMNSPQQFTAIGRDQNGNILQVFPVWSVANGGGTIAFTGLFTAGAVAGTFNNTVTATSGLITGTATVIVSAVAPPPPITNLGSAALNGIMAGTAVTCVNGGIINANVSISPGNTITGFGPCVITGVKHLNDGVAVQGQIDLTSAYNTLAGLPCPPANAIVANLGGTTKAAGVYCTAIGIGVTGTLTLDGGGDPNATFVFQAGTSLTTAGNIVLINGAQAKNVFWQVGSSATIGTASQWQGNILALTSITLVDNATLFGRALARNGAVSLGSNNLITLP